MKFLSVCSGIEAASVAWRPLGWQAWGLAEIEAFPSAVLAHHYPTVPNLGDMTKFKDWPDGSIDLLCGGTPCQSFSNAGLRAGLDDPRGQLMLTFGAIAARYRPRWLVWENVPGVLSSNGGRDFGAFLGLLGFLGYGFAYRVLDAQFVRVDGYGRAVPQRRNRVFVVGCLGDWRSAAAVLLEREGLRGDSAPRRSPGSRITTCLDAGPDIGGDGSRVSRLVTGADMVAGALAGTGPGAGWRLGADEAAANHCVAHTLRGEGFDASEDGTGRGTPLVPVPFDTTQITSAANRSSPKAGDPCHPLAAWAHAPAVAFGWQNAAAQGMPVDTISPTLDKRKHPAVAFSSKDYGADATADLAPTLRAMGHAGSHANGGGQMAVQVAAAVRRLMPVECERLQGFPDGYTAIPWRGKPASECPDGPRYKALGNSWAVNCARWIGHRIALVDQIKGPAC
jgi:DNA (cytosine-5)-methyltransferase 1